MFAQPDTTAASAAAASILDMRPPFLVLLTLRQLGLNHNPMPLVYEDYSHCVRRNQILE
jgi:hypothetical protein